MEITFFLNWLLHSGGSSSVASMILERLPRYRSLSSDKKDFWFIVASSSLSILAYLALTYVPVQYVQMVQPYFYIVYGVAAPILVGKFAHKLDKTDNKG